MKLTLEEIGVILNLMDEKIDKGNKENEHYDKALVSAYIKLMNYEHAQNVYLINSKQDPT